MRKIFFMALMALSLAMTGRGLASTANPIKTQKWSFQGMFGTFDRAAVKRGSQVFFEVCNTCHSLNMLSYRNLVDIGMSEASVKKLASEYEVQDGPNDEGDMFMRPALLSDHIVAPFANEKASRFANGGAFPPDLSVITKARAGGPDYVYDLLTGYRDEPPKGFEVPDGMFYNTQFPGHRVGMPPPLDDGAVTYSDGTPETLKQHAKDVVTFLSWAAEPELEERKSMGVKVLLYLIVLTAMLYALKRRIWNRICLDEYAHEPDLKERQRNLDKTKLPG